MSMSIGDCYTAIEDLLETADANTDKRDLAYLLELRKSTSDRLGVDYVDLHAFSMIIATDLARHFVEDDTKPEEAMESLTSHIGMGFEMGVLIGALYHREKSAALSEMFKGDTNE